MYTSVTDDAVLASCSNTVTEDQMVKEIQPISRPSQPIRKQYDYVIRMLVTVTVIFSICQIPDMIFQLTERLYSGLKGEQTFGIIAVDFVITNSSINLFIYTITSQRFKNQLLETIPFLGKIVSVRKGSATMLDSQNK